MTTFSLVLSGGTRAPIHGELTLGRAAGNQLRLADPAVSRRHARLVATPHGVEVHDLDSRTGTFLNGHRIARCALAEDGVGLRLGDTRLRVERDRSEHEAARTVIVPPGRTLHIDTRGQGADTVEPGAPLPLRPRLRSGWARKRLASGEGERRVVLENLRTGRFLQLTSAEASLLDLLDGTLTVPDLVRAVSAEHGERGVRRLLELLLELAELGMLAGAEAAPGTPLTGWRRLLRPREFSFARVPEFVARLYRAGGKWLFSYPAYALIAAIVLAGTVAFAAVVARGGVRPFHVGDGLALGSFAFIAGRVAVVALHELGHALTLTSLGRHPRRIGVKLLVVFPYAFVDTSEAWYEPRRRRIAVSMAGPITDALLAGAFALLALATAGVARDIAFQLALGAYLGTLLNLNPLLERDGYHVLADALREPNLRRRGREYVAARIAGRPAEAGDSRSIRLYGVAALAWGVVTAGFAGLIVVRIAGRQIEDAQLVAALAVLAVVVALVPTVLLVARPARSRRRGRTLEARESRSSLGGALGAGAIDAVSGHGGSSQLVRRASLTGQVEAATASASGSLDYPGDDAPRARIAAWMGEVAARRGLPRELPVMAALVESDLRNLPGGDAASKGYFQMQTTFWLASYPGYPDDARIQMRWFVDQALAVKAAQPGLASDPSRWGEWVAEIENPREDLRWKYGARLEDARALLGNDEPEPEPVAVAGTGGVPVVAETSSAPARAVVTGGLPATARADPSGYVDRLKAEAEDIDDAQVRYQLGGGHAERLDHDDPITPLDCSGAVSRVLGIDPRVSGQFETWGEPGPGERVTIYANAGHVLMEIDGHFWGTSRSNPGGGAGWIPRALVTPGYLAGFTARHPPGA